MLLQDKGKVEVRLINGLNLVRFLESGMENVQTESESEQLCKNRRCYNQDQIIFIGVTGVLHRHWFLNGRTTVL